MKFATFAVTLAIAASPTNVSADGAVDELIAMEKKLLAEEQALLSQQTPDVEADTAAADATAAMSMSMSMSTLVPMAGHASIGGDVANSWHSANTENETEPTEVTHNGSHHGGMSKQEYKAYAKAAKKHPSKSSTEAVEESDAHKSKSSKKSKKGKRGKKHMEGDAEMPTPDDGWSGGTMETAAADVEMSMPAVKPPAEPAAEDVEDDDNDAVIVEPSAANSTQPPAANSTRVGVDTKGISKASTAEQEARANVHDMVSKGMLTGKGHEHHTGKKGGIEGAAAELERHKSTDGKAFEASGSAAERSFRLGVALCLGTFVYAAGR